MVSGRLSGRAIPLAAVAVGALYPGLFALRPPHASKRLVAGMVVAAVAMRVGWFFVPAAPQQDHCRYLWDGAVSANGINPYRYAPKAVGEGRVDHPALTRLARDGADVLRHQTSAPSDDLSARRAGGIRRRLLDHAFRPDRLAARAAGV